jgi:uncharacterized protein YjiS (DUF1127 family)
MTTQMGYIKSRPDAAGFSEMQLMSAARQERAAFVGRGVAHFVRSAWAGVKGLFSRINRKRRIYAELMALDDRMLSDIGLTRGDIPFVAKGIYQREPRNDNRSRAA